MHCKNILGLYYAIQKFREIHIPFTQYDFDNLLKHQHLTRVNSALISLHKAKLLAGDEAHKNRCFMMLHPEIEELCLFLSCLLDAKQLNQNNLDKLKQFQSILRTTPDGQSIGLLLKMIPPDELTPGRLEEFFKTCEQKEGPQKHCVKYLAEVIKELEKRPCGLHGARYSLFERLPSVTDNDVFSRMLSMN